VQKLILKPKIENSNTIEANTTSKAGSWVVGSLSSMGINTSSLMDVDLDALRVRLDRLIILTWAKCLEPIPACQNVTSMND
jgi:hypothetical protein